MTGTFSGNMDVEKGIEVAATPTLVPTAADTQKFLERQQAMVAMGRRAVAQPNLAVLMEDSATMIAETLHVRYKALVELSPDGSKLTLQLTDRHDKTANRKTFVQESKTAGNDSLAGYALQAGHPVIVTNLAEEKRFHDSLLSRLGVTNALAVPLRFQREPFGALVACSVQEESFNDEDLLFVESIAHFLTTAIAQSRTEKALAKERRKSTGLLGTVNALVLLVEKIKP